MGRLPEGKNRDSQEFFKYQQGKTDSQRRIAIPAIFRKPGLGRIYIVIEDLNKDENYVFARVFICDGDGKDDKKVISQINQFYGDELAEDVRFTTEIVSIDKDGRICLPGKYFVPNQFILFVAQDGNFTIETKKFDAEKHLAGISDRIKKRVKEQLVIAAK